MRRFLSSLFFTHLCAVLILLLCLAAASAVHRPEIGWFLAAVVLFAAGYFARLSRAEAALVALLYGMFFVAWLSASPWGLIVLPIAVLFGVALSAHSVIDLFNGADTRPFSYIARRYIGLLLAAQTIDPPHDSPADGDAGKIGPRMVTVRSDAAVLVTASDQTSRLRGPGRYETRSLEYVSKIYSLRPKRKKFHYCDVLTQDNAPLIVDVAIIYGIDVREAARVWAAQLGQPDRRNLGRITAFAPQWEEALHDAVERNLRRSTGLRTLDDMLRVREQQAVGWQTATRTSSDTAGWGICIYDLQIVSALPDTSVVQASLQNWLLDITNETLVSKEVARGNAWAGALAQVADAYLTTRAQGVPDPFILRELVRRLFEQASMDPETRKLLSGQLNQSLDRRDVDQPPPR